MITATTRKTKAGYYQPVLIVNETKQRYTPPDNTCPCLDRATALKQAQSFANEAREIGYIPHM